MGYWQIVCSSFELTGAPASFPIKFFSRIIRVAIQNGHADYAPSRAEALFLVASTATTKVALFQHYACLLKRRPALKHAAKYAFFKCGEADAASGPWSWDVYDFVQRDASSFNQDNAVRQTYSLGNVMGHEHAGKPAAQPNVFDQLLHFDAGECVQRSQRFIQ